MLARVMEMVQKNKSQHRVTFGLFEADLDSGELWKAGSRVKLQGLPFKVLVVLLENAGNVVSREELHSGVWGPDVVVDFDHSLSNAIKKLREALGDSADNPRFIETLSRRGFRFIAPVGFTASTSSTTYSPVAAPPTLALVEPQPDQTIATPAVEDVGDLHRKRSWNDIGRLTLCLALGAVVTAGGLLLWKPKSTLPVPPRIFQITQEGTIYSPKVPLLGTLSAVATDGSHLFSPSNVNGQIVLSQISIATGASQTLPLPSQIGVPEVEAISPNGTQLLLRSNLAAASPQPLWIVPIDGGSAFRVSDVLAQSATWMPDGRSILYSTGNQISVVSLENAHTTTLATVPGRAFWPRWSPDAQFLRFTLMDTVNHTSALWELAKGETSPHPILKGWTEGICCGSWTADGKNFVFEATKNGYTDLWSTDPSFGSDPIRLTSGPLNYKAPLPGRVGGEIFFVGQDIHSRLERYDAEQKQYVPMAGFLATADHITYSRDAQWVAWVDMDSRLWRARVDGTEKVVLTPPSMKVFMANWNPDGTRLALMARDPGQPWQIYLVGAAGGTPQRLLQEEKNLGDPSFSADGMSLVFGIVPELMGQKDSSRAIGLMDLSTHTVSTVVHSEGMYSPRWSPDGRYIAALSFDQKQVMLFDTTTKTWKVLAATSAAHPVWSRDSKSIYVHAYLSDKKPVYRIRVPDGQMTEISNLSNFHVGSITLADFSGITPDNIPLMHAEVSSGNLYELDLTPRR